MHTEIYNPVCKQTFDLSMNLIQEANQLQIDLQTGLQTQVTYKLGAEAILSDRAVPVCSVSVTLRTLGNQ